MTKHIAIYVRVSSTSQDFKSQMPDLLKWANCQELPVVYYKDTASGKTMDRPQWNKLQKAMDMGQVATVVVWRLDRLGRTAAGLTKLFTQLIDSRINLISLKDGIDLETAAGRLIANVLASVAQFENEIRSERVRAGQAAAKAEGKKWGGRKLGCRVKVKDEQLAVIKSMKGQKVTSIARATGLSRQTIYQYI